MVGLNKLKVRLGIALIVILFSLGSGYAKEEPIFQAGGDEGDAWTNGSVIIPCTDFNGTFVLSQDGWYVFSFTAWDMSGNYVQENSSFYVTSGGDAPTPSTGGESSDGQTTTFGTDCNLGVSDPRNLKIVIFGKDGVGKAKFQIRNEGDATDTFTYQLSSELSDCSMNRSHDTLAGSVFSEPNFIVCPFKEESYDGFLTITSSNCDTAISVLVGVGIFEWFTGWISAIAQGEAGLGLIVGIIAIVLLSSIIIVRFKNKR